VVFGSALACKVSFSASSVVHIGRRRYPDCF